MYQWVNGMRVRVKICGITNLEDALAAAEAGADALGFVFYEKSLRYIQPEKASDIIKQLPPFINTVGVFVNAREEFIRQTIQLCGLSAVQFHGDEPPAECLKYTPVKSIKAFRVESESILNILPKYNTDAWLLDAFIKGVEGGTGCMFDWDIASKACGFGRPVILAGGLTIDNVQEAIKQVQPFAVDVSSGVEDHPGKKDHAKLKDFISIVREIDFGRAEPGWI
jgi:phosphoribosylanthranilate isomerase